MAACSPLLICLAAGEPPGGCAHTAGMIEPPAVALPAVPKFCHRVARPAVKAGDDARLAWRKTDAALGQANSRLDNCAAWYGKLRKGYSNGGGSSGGGHRFFGT